MDRKRKVRGRGATLFWVPLFQVLLGMEPAWARGGRRRDGGLVTCGTPASLKWEQGRSKGEVFGLK